MKYARSIKAKCWKSENPYSIDSVEDAQTSHCGELSVWLYDENEKNKVALAIAMTRDYISDVVMVIFDDMTNKGTLAITPQVGTSKWIDVNEDHVNLKLSHFDDFHWLMDYMWNEVLNARVALIRSKEIKKYFKECVKNNTISQGTIDHIHEHKDEEKFSTWERYLQDAMI